METIARLTLAPSTVDSKGASFLFLVTEWALSTGKFSQGGIHRKSVLKRDGRATHQTNNNIYSRYIRLNNLAIL